MPDPSTYRNALLQGAPTVRVPETVAEIRDQLFGGSTRRMSAVTGVSARNIQRYIAREEGRPGQGRTPSPATTAQIQDAATAEARWQQLEPFAQSGGIVHCTATVRISADRRVIPFVATYLDPAELGIMQARAGDWADAWDLAETGLLSAYFDGGHFDPTDYSEIEEIHDISIEPPE